MQRRRSRWGKGETRRYRKRERRQMSAAPRGWMKCKVRTNSIHPQPCSLWDPAKLFSHPTSVIYFSLTPPIYLWRKVVCLYLWDPLNWDASDCVPGLFGKLSMRRGAWAWFHDIWTCGAKVLEYWMIFSLKIKLNCSWKFWRNWNVPLVLLERSWWPRFNGIFLVRFGFNVGDIDF